VRIWPSGSFGAGGAMLATSSASRRLGGKARRRLGVGGDDLLGRLLRELGRKRRGRVRELHAKAVRDAVHAVELSAPHTRALAALGADREDQAVRRLPLVEDLLLRVRARQRGAHAAALPRSTRLDLELDAPQVLDVRRQHGQLQHQRLPAKIERPSARHASVTAARFSAQGLLQTGLSSSVRPEAVPSSTLGSTAAAGASEMSSIGSSVAMWNAAKPGITS
jgi:hypothetical protein